MAYSSDHPICNVRKGCRLRLIQLDFCLYISDVSHECTEHTVCILRQCKQNRLLDLTTSELAAESGVGTASLYHIFVHCYSLGILSYVLAGPVKFRLILLIIIIFYINYLIRLFKFFIRNKTLVEQ